jgi:hypothetical protein
MVIGNQDFVGWLHERLYLFSFAIGDCYGFIIAGLKRMCGVQLGRHSDL